MQRSPLQRLEGKSRPDNTQWRFSGSVMPGSHLTWERRRLPDQATRLPATNYPARIASKPANVGASTPATYSEDKTRSTAATATCQPWGPGTDPAACWTIPMRPEQRGFLSYPGRAPATCRYCRQEWRLSQRRTACSCPGPTTRARRSPCRKASRYQTLLCLCPPYR